MKLPPEKRGLAENWEKAPTYKAWLQLDFEKKDKSNNYEVNQYHENYGYDLKTAVGKYPVVEMDGGEKEKGLLQSLQKGNVQSVTVVANGEAQKMFIEANPQYKTVILYDEKMQRLGQEQRQGLAQKNGVTQDQSQQQEQKQDQKQDNKKSVKQPLGDDLDGSKKKTSRRKGMSI